MVLDPGHKEEAAQSGRLTVVVNAHKEICAVQKLDGVPLTSSMVIHTVWHCSSHMLRDQNTALMLLCDLALVSSPSQVATHMHAAWLRTVAVTKCYLCGTVHTAFLSYAPARLLCRCCGACALRPARWRTSRNGCESS